MIDFQKEQHPKILWRMLAWLGRRELATLVFLVLVTAGIWGFAELADEVMEGETGAFDRAVLSIFHNPGAENVGLWGPPWLQEIGRDVTALGGVAVLTLVTLAAMGFLLLQGKPRMALLLIAAILGGLLISTLMKLGFSRPRPEWVNQEVYVYTASFPSGHAMLSAITYLTLGALLARAQSLWRLKAYLMLLAILLTLLVGISRVYLGVHWPTDVLAGWTAGAVWALLCWWLAWWLQRIGWLQEAVEASSDNRKGDDQE